MIRPWLLRENPDSCLLNLHVQPGARKTEIAGRYGESLKIRLAAPPVDGKANDCLIGFIAETLGLPRAQVELVSGSSSRRKRLRVRGIAATAIERLEEQAD